MDECNYVLPEVIIEVHEAARLATNTVSTCICEFCLRPFPERISLIEHIRHDHGEDFLFTCEFCGKELTDGNSLRAHFSLPHHQPKYECVCSAVLYSKKAVVTHIKRTRCPLYRMEFEVADFPDFVCEICHKGFLTERGLTSHYDNRICRKGKQLDVKMIQSVDTSTEKTVGIVVEQSKAEKNEMVNKQYASLDLFPSIFTYESFEQEVEDDQSKNQITALLPSEEEYKEIDEQCINPDNFLFSLENDYTIVDEQSAVEDTSPITSKVDIENVVKLDVFLFSSERESEPVMKNSPIKDVLDLLDDDSENIAEIIDDKLPFIEWNDNMIFDEKILNIPPSFSTVQSNYVDEQHTSPDSASCKKRHLNDNEPPISPVVSSPEREYKKTKDNFQS